jgi:hypothetical protein
VGGYELYLIVGQGQVLHPARAKKRRRTSGKLLFWLFVTRRLGVEGFYTENKIFIL